MAHLAAEPVNLLDTQDRQHLLELVRQICETEIAALTERPEKPAEPDRLVGVLNRFLAAGILSGSNDRGLGLWDDPQSRESRSLSVDMLREIARTSPSVAYLVHTKALARWLDHSAGIAISTDFRLESSTGSTVSFDRTSPAGGRVLGQSFSRTTLDLTQSTALAQAWGDPSRTSEIISIDVAPCADVWSPQWTREFDWQFVRSTRTALTSRPASAFHGFDELDVELLATDLTASVQARDTADALLGADEVRTGFAAHSLGILAISLGAAEQALSRAREYAHNRTQGGSPIDQHDAVVQLMEQAAQSIAAAASALTRLGSLADIDEVLFEVWQARAHLQPALNTAGTNSLQVFGGIGYMRDVGAEKSQRDLNTLRRLGGSPLELTLRCGGINRETSRSR